MGALTAPQPGTLYRIEEELQSFLDSEDLVSEDLREQFRLELAAKMRSAIDKRQRVGEFIRFCELMQSNCEAEIDRLTALKKTYAAAQERCQDLVVYTIEQLGRDARGRYPRLPGHTVTLSVAQNPEHVEIADPEQVPASLRSVEVKLPLDVWQHILKTFDAKEDADSKAAAAALHTAARNAVCSVSKMAVREELKAGHEVPGADLRVGELRCKVS